MNSDPFARPGVLAIFRGFQPAEVGDVARLACEAGFRHIEVALNTPEARECLEALLAMRPELPPDLKLGAGTVRSHADLDLAISLGLDFCLSPGLNPELLARARQQGLCFVPGILTPGEADRALLAGAALVKLFPASLHGPAYIRMLKEPMQELRVLVSGGVRAENARLFLEAGADFLAVGGSLFDPRRFRTVDRAEIRRAARDLMTRVFPNA